MIAPSEWKREGWEKIDEKLAFEFEKPLEIAKNASEKDLKCKGKRYEEAISLNQHINSSPVLPAIDRYNGVIYSHIGYTDMRDPGKTFCD